MNTTFWSKDLRVKDHLDCLGEYGRWYGNGSCINILGAILDWNYMAQEGTDRVSSWTR